MWWGHWDWTIHKIYPKNNYRGSCRTTLCSFSYDRAIWFSMNKFHLIRTSHNQLFMYFCSLLAPQHLLDLLPAKKCYMCFHIYYFLLYCTVIYIEYWYQAYQYLPLTNTMQWKLEMFTVHLLLCGVCFITAEWSVTVLHCRQSAYKGIKCCFVLFKFHWQQNQYLHVAKHQLFLSPLRTHRACVGS